MGFLLLPVLNFMTPHNARIGAFLGGVKLLRGPSQVLGLISGRPARTKQYAAVNTLLE